MLQAADVKGVFIPVVVPFTPQHELDLPAYAHYLEDLLRYPVSGIVINGSTGEAPTVEWEEVESIYRVSRRVVERLGVHTAVIVGTGTNDTRTTVKRTNAAREWGADAALVVTPYYNRPSEEGVVRHFQAAAETGLPLIAYEVPARTGIALSADTMARILALHAVIGLKDATGGTDLLDALASRTDRPILAGADDTFARMLRHGASGGLLASAHFHTARFLEVCRLAADGLHEEADSAFVALLPLVRLLFQESNPAPIKWLLAHTGRLPHDALRLPMTPITPALQEALQTEIRRFPTESAGSATYR